MGCPIYMYICIVTDWVLVHQPRFDPLHGSQPFQSCLVTDLSTILARKYLDIWSADFFRKTCSFTGNFFPTLLESIPCHGIQIWILSMWRFWILFASKFKYVSGKVPVSYISGQTNICMFTANVIFLVVCNEILMVTIIFRVLILKYIGLY